MPFPTIPRRKEIFADLVVLAAQLGLVQRGPDFLNAEISTAAHVACLRHAVAFGLGSIAQVGLGVVEAYFHRQRQCHPPLSDDRDDLREQSDIWSYDRSSVAYADPPRPRRLGWLAVRTGAIGR